MEQGVAGLAVRQDVTQYISLMNDTNAAVQKAIRQGDILGLVEANSLFHQYFAHCSRNDYLIHGLHKVRCETNRLAYLSFSNEIDPLRSLQDHYASVVAQHKTIIECLHNRNDKTLKEILKEHTLAFQKRILLYMSS
jgi:DNA-binding GntR family transcriptional regulator